MIVKILPNDLSEPPNKLADAELLFEEGVLSGLRLVGFAIWQRGRGKTRSVTVPSRTYFVLGERRAYALLRPITDEGKVDAVRRLILESYAEFERRIAGPDDAAGDAAADAIAGDASTRGLLSGEVLAAGEASTGEASAGDPATADAAPGEVACAEIASADPAAAAAAPDDIAPGEVAVQPEDVALAT